MLTVAKITSGSAGGYADYLGGRARPVEAGDYYLKDGDRVEAPGRWVVGAGDFGLDGGAAVTGEQLRTLMAVRRPDSGKPLRRAGATGQVAALDATFSAPKSVSALWALAGTELRAEVERAHERAVDAALAYSIERVRMIRIRTGDSVDHAAATSLIATSWRHTTARAVGDRPPDPQLHSHVLLHGAHREDGRIVAIDSRAWLVHARELGAAYRSELARGLGELGFAIDRGTGRGARYFEVRGVPQDLIDYWSSRHHQVREEIDSRLRAQEQALEERGRRSGPEGARARRHLQQLRDRGQLSPAQDRNATLATRSPKDPFATHADLDERWRRAARDHAVTPEALRGSRPSHTPDRPRDAELARRLTEFDSRFPARQARAAALEVGAGTPIAEALRPLAEMRADGRLIELMDGTFTTQEHRAKELSVIGAAQRLSRGSVTPVPAAAVDRELAHLDQRLKEEGAGGVTEEQGLAIRLACSDHQLSLIEGRAGSGKSTVLVAAARAHQADGRRVIVTSTAAVAAERLAGELSDAGVSCASYSTVGLQAALRRDDAQLDRRTVVLHDEAALASTRELAHLFASVESTGARLIEVGDERQSQPVGAAGLWPEIRAAVVAGDADGVLTANVRARDAGDRRDQQLFREGQVEASVEGYAARGRVHFAPTLDAAEEESLRQAQADRSRGLRPLVVTQTSNDHLDRLNAHAQARRWAHGEIRGPGVPAPGRPYALHEGDEIQFRRGVRLDGRLRPVSNGSEARIQSVERDGRSLVVEFADGEEVNLRRDQVARGDIRLAYVQHPFPAQGLTSDTAHLIIGEHATREGSYVGLTRARLRTDLYVAAEDADDMAISSNEALVERLGETEIPTPSISVPLAHEQVVDRCPDAGVEDPSQLAPDSREREAATADASTESRGPASSVPDRSERKGSAIPAKQRNRETRPESSPGRDSETELHATTAQNRTGRGHPRDARGDPPGDGTAGTRLRRRDSPSGFEP